MNNDDSQRLARQFKQSLQRWGGWNAGEAGNPAWLTTPASDKIAQTFSADCPFVDGRYKSRQGEWEQMQHLSQVFQNACLVQQLDYLSARGQSLDYLLESLDSPIEALMLLSLIICAREHSLGVSVVWTHPVMKREDQIDFSLGASRYARLTLELRPQAQIGEHRVDFLLSFFGTDLAPATNQQTTGGGEWQEVRVDQKMIVECDGHDFHERTKEQAQRDKERDRTLQSLGFRVFRYTGSELYADVFKCAAAIVHTLSRRALPEDNLDAKSS